MGRASQLPKTDRGRVARLRRDESLGRISSLTKSVGIATLAATGILGLYLSKALPGHTTSSTPSANVTPSGATTGGSTSTGDSSASSQLSPPSSPPVASQQPAPVVSGAT